MPRLSMQIGSQNALRPSRKAGSQSALVAA